MIAETKIYRDFLKRNKVVFGRDLFTNGDWIVPLLPCGTKWQAADDDPCFTKVAAAFYYLKNRDIFTIETEQQ